MSSDGEADLKRAPIVAPVLWTAPPSAAPACKRLADADGVGRQLPFGSQEAERRLARPLAADRWPGAGDVLLSWPAGGLLLVNSTWSLIASSYLGGGLRSWSSCSLELELGIKWMGGADGSVRWSPLGMFLDNNQ